MISDLLTGFIYITGFLSLLMALGQLIVVERNAGRYIQALFLFCAGVCQVYNGMRISGFIAAHPHLTLINIPFLYSLGPLVYFYFRYLMHKSVEIKFRYFIHFLPASILVIILMPFYLHGAEYKRQILQYPSGLSSTPDIQLLYLLLMGFNFSVIILYCISFFRHNRYIFNYKQIKVRKIVYLSHSIVLGVLLVVIIYVAGTIFSIIHPGSADVYETVLKIISLVTGTIFLTIYIMDKRYPDYYNQLLEEMDHIQYQQSRIDGLNIDVIVEQLSILMENEKLYRVEDLTLACCARELEIAPYQLSQILNEKLKSNFCSYINAFRIDEARKIIESTPDRSLSTIGYDVGFNSVSAFYNWFCKLTGVSPGKYKDRYKIKK